VLARALFASLIGYAVGSFILSVAYQFFPYFLVAYTTALLSSVRKSAAQSREHGSVHQSALEKQSGLEIIEPEMSWRAT
jgi:hypothetical protein